MNDSHDHAPAGPARVVLATRKNAGIKVTLLWAEDTNAVAVIVSSTTRTRTPRAVASTTGSPT